MVRLRCVSFISRWGSLRMMKYWLLFSNDRGRAADAWWAGRAAVSSSRLLTATTAIMQEKTRWREGREGEGEGEQPQEVH